MRLLRALLVLVCISRAGAQTCAVGQVVVNSACTYNDPALKIWYKFEAVNPKLNSASASYGALTVNTGKIGIVRLDSAASLVLSSSAKEGVRSFTTKLVHATIPLSQMQQSGIFTVSFWVYLDPTYISKEYDEMGYETGGWDSFVSLDGSGGNLDFYRILSNGVWYLTCRTNALYSYNTFYPTTTIMGNWTHIAMTKTMAPSGSQHYNVINNYYVNGVLQNTETALEFTGGGANPWGAFGGEYVLSLQPEVLKLDDFRIYNRVLTAAEVMWLYKPCGEVAKPLYFETYVCNVLCNAGYTGPDGGPCAACVPGTYKIAGGSAACSNCGGGTYSSVSAATGAATCLVCPAGSYSLAGATACVSCAAGSYSLAGSTACVTCAAGSYSLAGSTACVSCLAGTYALAGSTACITCAAGSYSLAGSTACTGCPLGTYSTVTAASSVNTCVACPPGAYSGVSGASVCVLCPAGSNSSTPGSTSVTNCVCSAGFYGPNGGECTECPAPSSSDVGSLSVDNCTKNLSGRSLLQIAQTCTVGQVLVNSVCTYDDPSLIVWYKFDSNKFDVNSINKNSGSAGALGDVLVSSLFSTVTTNTTTVRGNGSHMLANRAIYTPLIPASGGEYVMTWSWWLYTSNYDDVNKQLFEFSCGSYTLCGSYPCTYAIWCKLKGTTQDIICDRWTVINSAVNTITDTFSGNIFLTSTALQHKWNHVAITFDALGIKLYFNGVLTTSMSMTSVPGGPECQIGLGEGVFNPALDKTALWKSTLIDDFRWYKRVLSATEIYWLYKPCGDDTAFYAATYTCPSVVCPAGQFGTSSCRNCSAGTYSGVTGASSVLSCTNCSAGAYSGVTGASSASACVKCPAGAFSGAAGATSVNTCVSCPAGTYSTTAGASSSAACTNCPVGAYSGVSGASSSAVCTSCPAGAFSSVAGATNASTCVQCPAGAFSSVAGATNASTCVQCPAGKYSITTGATSSAACTNCPVGAYSSVAGATNASTCVQCPAGAYSNVQATTSCMNCPPARTSVQGSLTSSDCGCFAGFYPNSSSCGTTSSNLAQSCNGVCTASQSSTVGSHEAKYALDGIINIDWGVYPIAMTDEDGSPWWRLDFGREVIVTSVQIYALSDWGPMSYAAKIGNSESSSLNTLCNWQSLSSNPLTFNLLCTNPLTGRYLHVVVWSGRAMLVLTEVKVTGCDTCQACIAGKYKNMIGNSSCTSCPAGTYSSLAGVTSVSVCINCPTGAYSLVGASSCVSCPVGTFSNMAGVSTCTSCPAGTYVNVIGTSIISGCAACPAGTYSLVGASSCVTCPVGTFSNVAGATACTSCPAGTNASAGSPICCKRDEMIVNSTCASFWTDTSLNVWYRFDSVVDCEVMTPVQNCFGKNYGSLGKVVYPYPDSRWNVLGRSGQTDAGVLTSQDSKRGTYSFQGMEGYVYFEPQTGYEGKVALTSIFSTNITVSSWIRRPACTSDYRIIVDQIFTLYFGSTSVYLNLYGSNYYNSVTIPSNNAWHHIVMTVDLELNNVKRVKLYVNAVLVDIQTKTFAMPALSYMQYILFYGSYSCTNRTKLDDFRLYNRSLTEEKVRLLYAPCVNDGYFNEDTFTCGCQAGYVSVNNVCVACQAGTYAAGGDSACTNCVVGTYSGATGAASASVCVSCSTGTYSITAGASSSAVCTNCREGTYSGVTGVSACLNCPAGAYSLSSGMTACILCVAGKYKAVTGNGSCVDCGANTYSVTVGASGAGACLGCADNAVSAAGSVVLGACVCKAGASGPNGGPCALCAVGKYTSANGTAVCTDCWVGSYSGTLGANSSERCLSCPDNSSSVLGSSLVTACTCNTGATGPNGGPCALCVPGKYKTVIGTSVCLNCSANTFSSVTGATSISACSNCGANSQSGGSSAACICNKGYTGLDGGVCLACVAGTFKSSTGSAECALCVNNTFSGVVGSTNASVCQACQSNAISAAGSVGQEYCYCKPGYAHLEGRHACRECTPGTYNSQLAQRACSNCTIGMYSLNYSAISPETCKYCPAGQWSPEGSANCNLCPVHSHTLNISGLITDCVCDPGYIGPGGSTCVGCSAGLYKDTTGSVGCVSCPTLMSSFPATERATDCWCVSGYIKVSGACVAMIPRPIQISGTLENLPLNPSPAQIQNASEYLRRSIAAQFNVAIELVQVDRVANSSNVQVLLFARSETELSMLQQKVTLATAVPGTTSLPFILLHNSNSSLAEARVVVIRSSVLFAQQAQSDAMDLLLEQVSDYFDVPLEVITYTIDAGTVNTTPLVTLSVSTSSQADFVRVLAAANALLGIGNLTLSQGGTLQIITVKDAGPSGLNFTNALLRADGSVMSGAEVQASLPALKQQLSLYYNVPQSSISLSVVPNTTACRTVNATVKCTNNTYSVSVIVAPTIAVSLANLQQKYSVASDTLTAPRALVLQLPFELDSLFYYSATGINDFFIETELYDLRGVPFTNTQIAQSSELLSWQLGEFFAVDVSRVHLRLIPPRYPMFSNASSVHVSFDCDAAQLPGLLLRGAELTATAVVIVQPAKIAGLANAVQRTVHGQMVDGVFVECKANFIVDALVCKCKPGYRLSGTSCIPCAAGTYGVTLDTLQCTACDVATFSLGGATACTSCHANSNASIGSSSQNACQCNPGFFFLTLVENGLLDYNTVANQYCLPCVNGSYKNQSGNFNCSTCLTQYYSSDALSCNTCNYGYAPSGTNNSVCTSCPQGSFKPTPDSSPCLLCAADTFSNITAALSCQTCPVGYRSLSGTVESEDCCAWNSRPVTNFSSVQCLCNAGYTGPDSGTSKGQCSACLPGTHKASNGSAACTNCSVGTYSPTVAADSNITCAMCPAGQYAAQASAICRVCPANSAALARSGLITNCLCNTRFTGPDGGPCVHCVPGTYKPTNGSAACTRCPLNSNSSVGSENITDCICDAWCSGPPGGPCISKNSTLNVSSGVYQCSPGFTGPDRTGPCVACAVGTYKSVTGSVACSLCLPGQYQDSIARTSCLTCAADTFANASGAPLCTQCPAGYKSLVGTVNSTDCCALNSRPQNMTTCTSGGWVAPYSTDVCVRFIALTPKPSFASISTRNNAAVGIMPTYNAAGGPNGKGHVSFDRTKSQYLDAGARTFNIATNGGVTIVAVVRFTQNAGFYEMIVDMGNSNNNNNILISRGGYTAGLHIDVMNGGGLMCALNPQNLIVQNSWMTIVLSYRSSTNMCSVTANGVVSNVIASSPITDRTVSKTWMGQGLNMGSWGGEYLNADLAGVFVVDEYLDSTVVNAIANAMIDGVDLTSAPCEGTAQSCSSGIRCSCNTGYTGPDTGASKGQCSICPAGTYKNSNGTANCTACPLNSNSSAGSGNITDCFCDAWCSGPRGGPCVPNNSTFNASSRVFQCSPGYTGPDRTGPCVACAVGTYKNVPGPVACTLCPPGQYQDAVARTSCLGCPPDTFQNATGSTACATCPAGFQALPATTTVQDCCGPNSMPSIVPLSPIEDLYRRKRPWAHYTPGVETNVNDGVWNKRQFTDVSGNARHTVQSKSDWWWLRNRLSGTKYIEGALDAGVRFPAGSIPEKFTICSSTRYGGESRKRILQMAENTKADGCQWRGGCAWFHGTDGNANQGFFWGATRYGNSWKVAGTQSTDRSWVDNNPYYLAGVWVVTCAKNDDDKLIRNAVENNVIIRNREYNVQNAGGLGNRTLVINYVNTDPTDPEAGDVFNSPWHFAHLMIWDSWLTLSEMYIAHEGIQSYMDTGKDFAQCGWSNGVCAPVNVCLCNPGYTGPDTGASKGQCAICPVGTYKPTNGSAACTSCPANSNSSVGSSNLTACSCNPGYTGPDGGPCPACDAGKFKNASGPVACEVCPANTYSASGALFCTACPAGFTSPSGSTVFSDCCDPNTTYAKNVYDMLSSTTKTAWLGANVDSVRVSSVPLLAGLQSPVQPNPPSYISSGGYNGQGFLRFSKISSTSGLSYMSSTSNYLSANGMTVVAVVRFMEGIKGTFWSMKYQHVAEPVLEIQLSDILQLCVVVDRAWGSGLGKSNLCTDTVVPINVWLQVTWTYSRSEWLQRLKVVYLSTTGTANELSKANYGDIYWGSIDQPKAALGYSVSSLCSGGSANIIPQANPACDRPNFDLAGFYSFQTFASDADISVLFQAMGNGSHIYYDKGISCRCNAGFAGTGRSDCGSCAPGTYKSEIRTGSCSLCAANTYSTAVQALNVSTCLSCPNNSESVAGRFECECTFGYQGDMYNCAACAPGKFKRVLGTSACVDCPANTEAPGFATKFCASIAGYNGLGYALEDVARSCGSGLNAACSTLSNGATSTGTAADGAVDSSLGTLVSVSFNPNLARACGNTGTGSCFASHEPVFLGAASLANDGNTNTRSETDYQYPGVSVRPYWRVDFGQSRTVFTVKILSLAWQYLKDFKITVGDSPDAKSSANVVCADYLTGSGSSYMTYTCEDSLSGRYLYVINGPHASNYLSISEIAVEAFNYAANASLMLPWWAVDFEAERAVSGLVIQAQASSVIQVRVGHSTDPLQNAVCAQNRTLVTVGNNNITCSSAMLGRYLFVIGTGNTLLVLNDVRVIGAPTAQCAAGTYKPLAGNQNCTACPAFSTSVVGATSIAQCSCRAGYLDVWS